MSRSAKIALGVAGAILALLLLAQIILPGVAANRIEDRLTENGGTAKADVSAFPAVSLLAESGSKVEVEGSGMQLDLETDDKAFDKLDGFDDVDLQLDNFSVGPVEVTSFDLTRSAPDPYKLEMHAAVTPADLAAAGSAAFGAGALGGLFSGLLLGQAASQEIPVDLDVEVESDDGAAKVVSGTAEIAGFDARPLAELITAAVAVRL